VIVVTELPPARRGRHPEPVACTRVAVIDASAMPDHATAAAWLKRASVGVETDEIARFLTMYRVAAADPYAPDFDPARASAIRIGYGPGAQLAAGEWTEVREVEVPAAPAPKRRSKHRPADRLAALLSGRDAILACEELTLRARADLERGRNREAALQLEGAIDAALAELAGWVTVGDLSVRLDELRELAPGVSSAAAAARSGTLEPAGVEVISSALSRLEAALRARAIYGADG
jgi:hypothetical protein